MFLVKKSIQLTECESHIMIFLKMLSTFLLIAGLAKIILTIVHKPYSMMRLKEWLVIISSTYFYE